MVCPFLVAVKLRTDYPCQVNWSLTDLVIHFGAVTWFLICEKINNPIAQANKMMDKSFAPANKMLNVNRAYSV